MVLRKAEHFGKHGCISSHRTVTKCLLLAVLAVLLALGGSLPLSPSSLSPAPLTLPFSLAIATAPPWHCHPSTCAGLSHDAQV